MPTTATPLRTQLLEQGYCLFENVLDHAMIQELERATEELLAAYPESEAQRVKYQGSKILLTFQYPVFPRLFAWPKAIEALHELGYAHPKWQSAYLLSKPPHGPPLYWHQDWAAWDEPVSADPEPAQIFLMYYLTDTTRENGCLRVIPGTHRRRIPFHDELPEAHADVSYGASLDDPLFRCHSDEIDIPVRAGDLVIGDSRLLHAAHPNSTDKRRSLLTLWYFPTFDNLSEPLKARFGRSERIDHPDWEIMQPYIAYYEGSAEPAPRNRTPGKYLRSKTD